MQLTTHNSQLTPRKLGLAILLALGSALSQASLAADSLTGLSDLAGSFFLSEASSVSADGAVVGVSSSGSGTEAFRWTQAGGM